MRALFKFSIFLVLIFAAAIGIYLYVPSPSDEDVTSAPGANVAPTPIDPSATASVAPPVRADVDGDAADAMISRALRSLNGWRAYVAAEWSGSQAQMATAAIEKLFHADETHAPAVAEVSNDVRDAKPKIEAASPAGPLARSEVESSTPDENCKLDEERLERLRLIPSIEEAERLDNELRCETLRPQLLGLMKTLAPGAPTPASADVSNGVTNAKVEAAPPVGPLSENQVALSTPDENCTRDEERLERLRNSPSSEEAIRFDDELRCERLRPQLLEVMKALESVSPAPAPAPAEVSASAADAKTKIEAAPPAGPAAGSEVALSTPDENCKRDEERLERLRSSPSSEEAVRFDNELRCEKLRPQLLGLMNALVPAAPAPAAAEVADGVADAKTKIEATPPAAPLAESEVALSTPDDNCKHDEERLQRLRGSPSSEEAQRFDNELRCETLRPQLLRLMESLGYAPASASQSPPVRGMSAQEPKAAGDCVSEQDRLNRIRARPSIDEAQQFWRDLQCERLRPQARLLLESLNGPADAPGACPREAEELNRIRTNPNRREAESFARDMTCDALKPQAARLLESLAE